MKFFTSALLVCFVAFGFAQGGHGANKGAEKLKDLSFIVGSWKGKQNFQTGGATSMSADITSSVTDEIEGRFIQEKTTTTLPNGGKGSAIHMIGYDAAAGMYKVWWFNDTSATPQVLQGTFDGAKLVMNTLPGAMPTFRATYTKSDKGWSYQLELKRGDDWRTLFVTNYGK